MRNGFLFLERFQILDQIVLFVGSEPEGEACVVALHHVEQRLEAAIMIEAALFSGRMNKPRSRTKVAARFIVLYA